VGGYCLCMLHATHLWERGGSEGIGEENEQRPLSAVGPALGSARCFGLCTLVREEAKQERYQVTQQRRVLGLILQREDREAGRGNIIRGRARRSSSVRWGWRRKGHTIGEASKRARRASQTEQRARTKSSSNRKSGRNLGAKRVLGAVCACALLMS